MAELSYLNLTNDSTGEAIAGDVTDSAWDGHIEVVSFEQEASRPTHPQSGMVTGETAYGALKIVKPIDKASPLLQMGLKDGNQFTGQMKFIRTNAEGRREHWYTIEFGRASLVGIRMYKPLILDADKAAYPDLEELSFRFVQITWTQEVEGIMATADWGEGAQV